MPSPKSLLIFVVITIRTTLDDGWRSTLSLSYAPSGPTRQIRSCGKTINTLRNGILLRHSTDPLKTFSLNTITLIRRAVDAIIGQEIKAFTIPTPSAFSNSIASALLTSMHGLTEVILSKLYRSISLTSSAIDGTNGGNLQVPNDLDPLTNVFGNTESPSTKPVTEVCMALS